MLRFSHLFILYISLISCTVSNSTFNSYDSTLGVKMHPEFKIYHLSEFDSRLHFKILTDEILYTRNNRGLPFEANLILKYNVKYFNNKLIVDSGTIRVHDKYTNNKKAFLDTALDFNFELNKFGSIEIEVRDVNRSRSVNKAVEVNKKNLANEQFFSFKDTNDNFLLSKHFHSNQTIYITSNFHKDKELYAVKNTTNFPFPAPPFSKTSYKSFPKKTKEIKVLSLKDKKSAKYTFSEKGLIYFQTDTLTENGFTLYNFHKNYPMLKTANELIPPLRYLTTRDEYELLNSTKNVKETVDQFWLNKAHSNERARTLIRNYYSRVQLANELFTSHKEGWKTDRGLISIIFGSPSFIRYNKNNEIWIYGNDHNSNTIKFTFEKIKNIFSNNDYILKRNYAYKTPWYIAVETWRNGKVYWLQ